MSLYRFAYYSAVLGAWAAFGAWLMAELLLLQGQSQFDQPRIILVCAMVGAALGAAINLTAAQANPSWKHRTPRLGVGLLAGLLGGGLGAMIGQATVAAGLPLAIGWALMGAAIGTADGLFERSPRKTRNGLIGGLSGGFIGGAMFAALAAGSSNVPGRALAFTILGLAIGGFIGLAHVALKDAWLTVLDGFRPGRQLILTQPATVLGRGDHLPLPLLGYAGRNLEIEHARILRRPDGQFAIEDLQSRIGTLVNGRPVEGIQLLHDGDLIKLGSNLLRFHLRRGLWSGSTAAQTSAMTQALPGPPLPPGAAPARSAFSAGPSPSAAAPPLPVVAAPSGPAGTPAAPSVPAPGGPAPPLSRGQGSAIPVPPSAVPASFRPRRPLPPLSSPALLPPQLSAAPLALQSSPAPLPAEGVPQDGPSLDKPASGKQADCAPAALPRIPPPPPPPPPRP